MITCLVAIVLAVMALLAFFFQSDTNIQKVKQATHHNTQRPTRIISLSPHWTELLFALGEKSNGAIQVIAVSAYSNYPLAAQKLPVVGNAFKVDIETIARLNPDWIFYWPQGTNHKIIKSIQSLNIKTFSEKIDNISQLQSVITQLGTQLGVPHQASQLNQEIQRQLHQIKKNKQLFINKNPNIALSRIGVFFQVWDQPLMTINQHHFIHQNLKLCGIQPMFGELPSLTPILDPETVIRRQPSIWLTAKTLPTNTLTVSGKNALSAFGKMGQRWLSSAQFPHQMIAANADLISRPTVRGVGLLPHLCQSIYQAAVALSSSNSRSNLTSDQVNLKNTTLPATTRKPLRLNN